METMQTPPPLTFEQVMAILDKRSQEAEKRHQDFMANLEIEKQLRSEEIEKRHQETLAKIEADNKLYEKLRKEEMKLLEDKHNKAMGELTRRFGELVEYSIAPDLCSKFYVFGFDFKQTSIRHQISDGKDVITEIDILLEDGDSVMAVEVKAKPTMYDLKRHLKRLEQAKQYPSRSIRGAKLYGAIAGAVVTKEIRETAFKKGLYVVTHSGENVTIVPPPEGFVAKYWEAKSN